MKPATARIAELQLAVMLLTRLPAGQLKDPAPKLSDAQWAYPLVGLIVGLIAGICHGAATGLGAGPALAAILSLSAMILSTGALHQDGLADFADGMWGGHDRARRLEIMRDSRIGSYGVLALGLCCAIWSASVAQLAGSADLAAFLAIGVLSRIAMTVCLATMPPARNDGLGAQAGRDTRANLTVSAFLALGAVIALGLDGLIVMLVVAAVTFVIARTAQQRVGGQTGDVLGAVQFLAETSAWATLAILSN